MSEFKFTAITSRLRSRVSSSVCRASSTVRKCVSSLVVMMVRLLHRGDSRHIYYLIRHPAIEGECGRLDCVHGAGNPVQETFHQGSSLWARHSRCAIRCRDADSASDVV